jgi:hypothetical protein
MTKTIELSIRRPAAFDAALWPAFNERLMKLLYEKYELIPSYTEQCNWDFDSFLHEKEIKDIAVFIFGNDLPSTVKFVKELVIVGDGDCPVCGSNNRSAVSGGFDRDDETGFYAECVGYKCNNCNFIDLK